MLRPLYLYFCGRLDTTRAKTAPTSYGAHGSKERFVLPGNSRWGRSGKGSGSGAGGSRGWGSTGSKTLHGSDRGDHDVNVEKNVDLELGPKTAEELGTKTEAWAT